MYLVAIRIIINALNDVGYVLGARWAGVQHCNKKHMMINNTCHASINGISMRK
jgi:hypothetical protein